MLLYSIDGSRRTSFQLVVRGMVLQHIPGGVPELIGNVMEDVDVKTE